MRIRHGEARCFCAGFAQLFRTILRLKSAGTGRTVNPVSGASKRREGMFMELWIARHGETESNAAGRALGGGGDAPLTAEGIRQAKQMGESLRGISFDAVYASPLGRAINTAAIAFQNRVRPILDERLIEIGLGEMEGLTWEEITERYPASSCFMSDPVGYIPPPSGETLSAMLERVDAFLQELAGKPHQRVFVLTHGYVLRVVYACMTDHSLAAIGKAPPYGNCAVARYRCEDGHWTMS